MVHSEKKWYRFVPNLITSFNLISGTFATFFAFEGNILAAIILLLMASLFDFLDGMIARLLKVSTTIGKELDSLADLISFGLLPGTIVFSIQCDLLGVQDHNFSELTIFQLGLLFIPILIPVLSAIRLAKFNLDTRQTEEFIGMPTPANALFWTAIAYNNFISPNAIISNLQTPIIIALLVLATSLLLNIEIRLLSLKFKNLKWKSNAYRYLLFLGSVILFLIFGIPGLAFVIIYYILLSIIRNTKSKKA